MGVPPLRSVDAIDQAIAVTQPAPAERLNLQVGIEATGRMVTIGVPLDVEPADLFAVIGFITNQLPKALAQAYLEAQGKALEVVQAIPEGLSMPGRA